MGSIEQDRPQETGENYISIREATQVLGKCTKTIRNYIKHGILPARRFRGHGRTLWIRRDDVEALTRLRDMKYRTSDIWDLLQTINLRLRSIDERMNFLMRVNGLDISALRDAPIEMLKGFYDEAETFLELNAFGLPYQQMEQWAKVLLQFTEIEYERLVGPTQDLHPWKTFYFLCRHLMRTLRQRKGFATHPRMQQAYRLLDKARKHINQSAMIFEETQASEIGPRRVAEIAGFGLSDDSLDRYIAAETFPPPKK